MSTRPLATLLAARDTSSGKAEAIEALLACLETFDAIDHYELARTTAPIEVLAEVLAGQIELQQEKIDTLETESAENETRALNLQAELDVLKAADQNKAIVALQERVTELETRLASAAALVESYSDMLAMARKFVASAEGAGLKTRHARPAPKKGKLP